MSTSGCEMKMHVAARAVRVLGTHDHVAGEVADVRQELERAVVRARAPVIVRQRRGQRDRASGDRRDGQLFPLRRVAGRRARSAEAGACRESRACPRVPARHRLLELERRLPGQRLRRPDARTSALFAAPCMRHRAEADQSVPSCSGSTRRIDRRSAIMTSAVTLAATGARASRSRDVRPRAP